MNTLSKNDSISSNKPHVSVLPVAVPEGHVGPVVIPGSNRQIWWTGRVAIGLRYERQAQRGPVGESALWVQDLMLAGRRSAARYSGS